jgi:RimJ/RimL family protein N-acetyltransferase
VSGRIVAGPLIGPTVRLDATTLDDAPGLLAAAGSPETFRWFTRQPTPLDESGMREHARFLIDAADVQPLTLRLVDSGEVIGMTSYLDIRPEHRTLEIGWTFIAPAHRGTRANPEMKRLLLAHAFETPIFPPASRHAGGGALRVCLKTHHRNERSQRAMARLGAKYEGTLRNLIIMPDGSSRHSVFYSIIAHEWPAVRDGLDRRLA